MRRRLKMDIEAHLKWFEEYADRQIASSERDAFPLRLKLRHTWEVAENARKIAQDEKLDPSYARLVHLSALYHDIGRFPQYQLYGTFRDAESCNHARMSIRIVRQEKRLAEESTEAKSIVLTAIGVHNLFAIPARLSARHIPACEIVRDADKLDILRVIAQHLEQEKPYNPTVVLSLPDRDDLWSEKMIEAVFANKTASYQDLRSVNDFRLLLGAWIFDMRFASSRKQCIEAGYAHKLVEAIPENEIYKGARAHLLQALK